MLIKTAIRNGELNEGRIIASDLAISKSNKVEPLRLLVDAKKTNLFLRIDDRDCIDCIDSSFQTIINSRMDTNKVKVIILGHYANINSEKFFFKKVKFTKDFYNCDSFPLPAESVISPYFFTLDASFRTKKVFFPVKEYPNYNITELKKIVNN